MTKEEKFFVEKGIQEEYWSIRTEGYWLCCKEYDGIWRTYFYVDKAKADAECEKLRKEYEEAIAFFREGDEVWFIHDHHVYTGNVEDIFLNSKAYYKIHKCDDYLTKDRLFSSKDALLKYLQNNVVDIKRK